MTSSSEDSGATPGSSRRWRDVLVAVVVGLLVGVGGAVYVAGPPAVMQLTATIAGQVRARVAALLSKDGPMVSEAHDADTHDADAHAHDADNHAHDDHADQEAVELTEQARKSIGLSLGQVSLSTFQRMIRVPGTVVERPGRTRQAVVASLTGQVTRVYRTPGEAVLPGQPLFEVRLTHEELVQAQAALLETAEELDVVERERARLEELRGEGLIATKRILEQEYEMQKLKGRQRAQRQGLMLHGLTEDQVNTILSSRTLLSTIAVCAPAAEKQAEPPTFLLYDLKVERGEHVTIGKTLAILADYSTLMIEGEAYEKDIPGVTTAAAEGRPISVTFESGVGEVREVEGLAIAYLGSTIDASSRTLDFFVTLPNEQAALPAEHTAERAISWRYRPGQRVEVNIPVEEWPERIVLPAAAVAQDGVENYVFRVDGPHFDRQAVQVEYRDPRWVVIANDGAVPIGETVALTAARQLLLALKNQSGGGVDPHAGHHH